MSKFSLRNFKNVAINAVSGFKSSKKKFVAFILIFVLLASAIVGVFFSKKDKKEFVAICETGVRNYLYKSGQSNSGSVNLHEYSYTTENASCIAEKKFVATDSTSDSYYNPSYKTDSSTATIDKIVENDFILTKDNPISTFSSDIDTASYVSFRQLINNGYSTYDMPSSVFRTEEMVNYFSYNYNTPKGNETFGITTEVGSCPWNPNNSLVRVGIKAKEINVSKRAPLNLVFLIDVSGSMYTQDKLPLLKQAFASLVNNLNKKDTISVVTYSGGAEIIMDSVKVSNKKYILNKINSLEASGGTNGGEGLKLAYKLASKNYNKKSNNRIVLATDGDLNIGMTSTDELKNYISKEKEKGIFLSVLGFGNYQYNDSIMETLADNGNGNYTIVDTLSEAKKVLTSEFMGTMYTVAKDVKFQMTFDPKYVQSYRLIGYENRIMNTEDFDDDTKDAGDMGSGQALTILYEINNSESVDSSYGMTLKIRYKEPTANTSQKLDYNINTTTNEKLSNDFVFISSIVETAMLLNNSKYLGNTSLNSIKKQLSNIELTKKQQEFVTLLDKLSTNNIEFRSAKECN